MSASEAAKGGVGVLKQTVTDFSDDECMSRAAAIAYYSIFSMPPILVLVIMLTGWLGQGSAVEGQIAEQFDSVAGQGSYEQIAAMADNTKKEGSNVLASLIGIAVLVFSATGVLAQLQASLNRAWEVEPDPEQGGVKNFLMKRVLSLGMILTLAFLLLVSAVLSLALTSAADQFSAALGLPQGVTVVVPIAVNVLVITILFAAMFKVLPDAEVSWRDVLVGALFTAVLFIAGKYAIAAYLRFGSVETTYGQAGKLVAVLIWFYYSSVIVLFGAEFTQAWAQRFGTAIRPSSGAVKIVEEKRHVRGQDEHRDPGLHGAART